MQDKILQDSGDHQGLNAVWGFGHNTFIIKLWKNPFFFMKYGIFFHSTWEKIYKHISCKQNYPLSIYLYVKYMYISLINSKLFEKKNL